MRPNLPPQANADENDTAGHWESAGAAVMFSAGLGMTHLTLQLLGIAPSDTFIGPHALALISVGLLTLGLGMIWQSRKPTKRNPDRPEPQ